jgi:hypothetical protein
MLGIISAVVGLFSSALPNLVNILEKRQESNHEIKLMEMRIEAASKGVDIQRYIEDTKADIEEGKSVRQHDALVTGDGWIFTLRTAVRPVLTFLFFFLFLIIKLVAVFAMLQQGAPVVDILNAVWDEYTVAIFGAIIGFWFGHRAFLHILGKENNKIL